MLQTERADGGADGLRVAAATPLVYLDQNYLSGIAKRKPGFVELEPVLRASVAAGVVAVPESEAHRLESAPRPDLGLLELLRGLSGGLRLPEGGRRRRECARRLRRRLERDFPERRNRASDELDVLALSAALPHCRVVTCDAFMADVIRRAGLDVQFRCRLYTGRRRDVLRLAAALAALLAA